MSPINKTLYTVKLKILITPYIRYYELFKYKCM